MEINDFFDKVFLINLDSSEERLKNSSKELERLGISFERIPAIDGCIEKIEFYGTENDRWNNRSAALSLTTENILKSSKGKYSNILIFEDDIRFKKSANQLITNGLNNLPNSWEIIVLNTINNFEKISDALYIKRIKKACCCQAYALNSSVFDDYIELLSKRDRPIDECLVMLQEKKESYAIYPFPIAHDAGYSTIRKRNVNYLLEA